MTKVERILEDYRQLPDEEKVRFRKLILVADEECTEENGGAFLGQEMMEEIEREVDDALAGKVEIIKVDDIDALIDRELGLE